jgi:plastocyanin
MAVYFVLGATFVVWALVLTLLGLTREGFPPSRSAARGLMGVSAAFLVAVLVALISTTEKEHPREEAKAKAAEKAREAKPVGPTPATGALQKGKPTIGVTEKEYSVTLAGGVKELKPGKYTFVVANVGQIQHDLAVEGPGLKKEAKTPLIAPHKGANLQVDLPPGKYKLFCTVPGHEQLGMKTAVTVSG